MLYAEVIIDINHENVDKIFHYRVPDEMKTKIHSGMRVFVPFGLGNKIREGYIVGFTDKVYIDINLIKDIYKLPEDYQIFNENMINLAKFISNKYYCLLSEALQCIMPSIVNLHIQKYVSINYQNPDINLLILEILQKKTARSQIKIIRYLQERDLEKNLEVKDYKNYDACKIYIEKLKKDLNVTNVTINSLEKKGIIVFTQQEVSKYNLLPDDFSIKDFLELNQEQLEAYSFIKSKLLNNKLNNKPILINGVTGSGKTEIYLRVVKDMLEQGKQAIVLVPEIALTSQTLDSFLSRFGNKVSITHSKLNNLERLEQWKKAKDGQISIMVGARSAIFTPFQNLGVIIIDEEHESAYKSDVTPKYDAREIALKISEQTGALVIFGSATPSIETYYKANTNIYDLIYLNNKVNNTQTNTTIVDMREELKQGNTSVLSIELYESIKYNLENNLQTILFLNRRGHSTFVSCRECGYVLECNNCSINYTYHTNNFNNFNNNTLICHYCDSKISIPKTCPSCNSSYIKYFGTGTQKLEEQILKYFPTARILRMDLDTTSTKNSHQNILNNFKNHNADILIGTQMIAKGLDFPKVSLVGVIAADIALNIGNYKSAETCFQLLTQVCGRSGRGDIEGRAIIQTYMPENSTILLAKNSDYQAFYNKEILYRKNAWYHPFCNMFFILFSSPNQEEVFNLITYLHSILIYYKNKTDFKLIISDVSKASIYRIKNKYRYKIMIKANNNISKSENMSENKDEERLKNFVMYCMGIFKDKKDISNISISLSLNPNSIP